MVFKIKINKKKKTAQNSKKSITKLCLTEIQLTPSSRLATRVLVVTPMTFTMTQQRTRTICNPKLIALFARLEKFKGPIRLKGCEILSFHWIRETAQIEVIIVRPNFHVNIAKQFTISECMRPSFEGSVNMDL